MLFRQKEDQLSKKINFDAQQVARYIEIITRQLQFEFAVTGSWK